MLQSLRSALPLVAIVMFAVVFPAAAATHPSAYGQLPLTFERNEGQADPAVRYVSRGRGYSLFLTSTEAVLRLKGDVVRWQIAGADRDAQMTGELSMPGKTNYFIGNDPAQWRTGVENFARVRQAGVYPGVDLVYHGNQRQVEYDFVVAPHADPDPIRISFSGIDAMRLGDGGELILETAHGRLVQPRPVVYQERGGVRETVDGRFVLLANNEIRFALGAYDRDRALVIDPIIQYATYFGGTGIDQGLAIVLDSASNAYVTGYVDSTSFPGSSGSALQSSIGGSTDTFVTKINAAGTAVLYSTYLGGTGDEYAAGLAVDGSGNAYVAGQTNSSTFPGVSGGSIQSSNAGGVYDAFLTKINAAGSAITYSTFLGGSGEDSSTEVMVDGSGNAYVAGTTTSTTFPGVSGGSIQSANGGNYDAFVTKINGAGSAITYSTFLGGSGDEIVSDIIINSSGNAFVAGVTASTSFPGVTGSSLQPSNAGGTYDGFLTKLNTAGSAITWSTFLGGSGTEFLSAMALDSSGNLIVAGDTDSTSFPGVTGGSLQSSNNGGNDAFLTKINSGATAITWSTFLGGNNGDFVSPGSLGLDSSNNVYVGGATLSTTFNGVNGSSMQPSSGGGTTDSWLAKLNSSASSITWATFLGGSGSDNILAMAVDASGNIYATGVTTSTSYPGVTGASLQSSYGGGGYDAFVVKVGNSGSPAILSISPSSGYPGTSVTILGTNFGATQGTGSVWLGNKLAGSITSWSNTQIVAVVASGALSGSAQVQKGGVWSNSLTFTIITPNITSISPSTGYPGTSVTINGTNFGATQGSGSVWLGNKLAGSITSWSNTQIVAVVAATALSGSVQVQQGGVWGNSVTFTVITPNITSVSPTTGYPGTSVTINGTNFGATQGSGSVWLGNKLAGSITSWSNTQIVAVVAATATSGSVQVQQGGVWSNSIAFTVVTPSLTSITPTSGIAGTSVTLNGTNFGATQGSGSVWLGSKLAGSITSWSNTQIVAVVASGAVTGNAQVQQGGVWSNQIAFTVPSPVLASIDPDTARAGEEVTLTGTNFGASQGSGSVWLGSKLAGSIVSWSDTEVVATVASGAVTGNAQVQQGGVWTNQIAFNVITPVVSSIDPEYGEVGTEIGIFGTGFGDTQGSGLVWIGTKYATVTYWSDEEIYAEVAGDAATGGVQVFQNGVWSNGNVIFQVTDAITLDEFSVDDQVVGTVEFNVGIGLNDDAPSGGAVVSLTSNNAAVIVPATVTIPEGQSFEGFWFETEDVAEPTTVTLSATYGGRTMYGEIEVVPSGVQSFQFDPSTLVPGEETTGTIVLHKPAPTGGAVVTLTSDNPDVLTLPATVTVPQGETEYEVEVTAGGPVAAVVDVNVSAEYNNGIAEGSILVMYPPLVTSLSFTPSTVEGGEEVTVEVTLAHPAAAGTVVTFQSNFSAAEPPSLAVPVGETTASAIFRPRYVEETIVATVDGTIYGPGASATLTVDPVLPTLASFEVTPSSVVGSHSATGTVTLTGAAEAGGVEVDLSVGQGWDKVIRPAFVVVPEGETSMTFPIGTIVVEEADTAYINARHAVAHEYDTLDIDPPAGNFVASLTLAASRTAGGNLVTATVTLDAEAGVGGAEIALESSNTGVATVPSTVTVTEGNTTITFDVDTDAVMEPHDVIVRATWNDVIREVRLTVLPTSGTISLVSVTLPDYVIAPDDAVGTVTISSAAPVGGILVTLGGSRAGLATVPASVLIPEGETSAEFTITTIYPEYDRSIMVTATYDGLVRTALLVVADQPE
ncbi:MAG TPA: IPT/TIG domain-containing protein [Thermoanaerobaculia bacterium]|jgi:hypothetical protein